MAEDENIIEISITGEEYGRGDQYGNNRQPYR